MGPTRHGLSLDDRSTAALAVWPAPASGGRAARRIGKLALRRAIWWLWEVLGWSAEAAGTSAAAIEARSGAATALGRVLDRVSMPEVARNSYQDYWAPRRDQKVTEGCRR